MGVHFFLLCSCTGEKPSAKWKTKRSPALPGGGTFFFGLGFLEIGPIGLLYHIIFFIKRAVLVTRECSPAALVYTQERTVLLFSALAESIKDVCR